MTRLEPRLTRRWLKLAVKWNERQEEAILSRNGTVLVSAAAGSGKSAVLVERVIQRLCDETNKCPADSLMIVTFTNAAASGLRHKINKALGEKIKENPNNEYLSRQQRLLSSAVIGTMDSFCGSLVRENFFLSDIETDFRILDNTEEALLMNNAVDSVLEKYYDEKPDGFIDLLELFGSDKNDYALINNVFECYKYAIAYPFPEKWIDSLLTEYNPETRVGDTASGRVILNNISLELDYCIKCLDSAIENCLGIDELEEKYIPELEDKKELCSSLLLLCKNGEWDLLKNELDTVGEKFGSMPRVSKESQSLKEKGVAMTLRNTVRDKVRSLWKKMPLDEAQYREDCLSLTPALTCFVSIIKEFFSELLKLKKEENAYSFSDISHFALNLLVDENGNKTDLAKELSERFCEILIDEYQDTNKAQDMLFSAISKDETNLFIVGDVKQSIYRFRKAMPEIFIGRREKYEKYDRKTDNYPSKIFLDSNYRSRKGIIDSVNFVFKRIMKKETGDIDYGKDEYLNYSADYDNENIPCEIHFLRKDAEKNVVSEPEHIAREIEKLISSRVQVKDGENMRDIRYSDICILTRKKKYGPQFVNEFKKHGIPAVCEANESFCNLYEVSVILSLLKAVDNPLNDMALLTTLFSPIYGFTPDELALIRLEGEDKRFYSCLKKYASHNEKAQKFLNEISEFKKYSVIYSTSELLRRVFEETAFDEIVRAMPNGEKRASNLMHLLDFAENFEKNGNFGLNEFLRFIDRVTSSGRDISVDSSSGSVGNSVQIMTIHKSKGLEFPVVFIAKCNESIQSVSKNPSNVELNPETKLGVKRQDRELLYRYPTVQYVGTGLKNYLDDISEEIRILYVAMTRAKERLFFVISDGNVANSINLESISKALIANGVLHPASIIGMSNFAKWILACAFTASGCKTLRDEAGCDLDNFIEENTDYITYKSFYPETVEEETEEDEQADFEVDESFVKELEERINYVYPYSALTAIAAKRTASGLNEQKINDEYFASEKPAFMGKDSFTPAQRGTFTHLFMEKCDFLKAAQSVDSELERLTADGLFTPEQAKAVNIKTLRFFFNSDLFKRMVNSDGLFREKQFTVTVPASFFESDVSTDESVVVQGKIDCFFIENGNAVIVDYKTDYVKSAGELKERYTMQMEVYKNAVEQFTGKKVKEVLLYSFTLDEIISV